mmetsp:Transcript_21049/g.63335  ORF Transcript_21049/g.63335 Transcript_21049/m.63335 type:complete len:202 (-) Transcript_21049:453-1058(-)
MRAPPPSLSSPASRRASREGAPGRGAHRGGHPSAGRGAPHARPSARRDAYHGGHHGVRHGGHHDVRHDVHHVHRGRRGRHNCVAHARDRSDAPLPAPSAAPASASDVMRPHGLPGRARLSCARRPPRRGHVHPAGALQRRHAPSPFSGAPLTAGAPALCAPGPPGSGGREPRAPLALDARRPHAARPTVQPPSTPGLLAPY